MKKGWLAVPLLAMVCAVGFKAARWGKRRLYAQSTPQVTPIAVEAGTVASAHPRLLLTPTVLERLRSRAKKKTPAWQHVRAACDRAIDETIEAGYEGFEWGDAVANLSLCFHVTGEKRFADRGVFYLQALADDRNKVGDRQGGAEVVRHDDGYGIRTYGVYAALGYDWLHDSIPPALRSRLIERLTAWLAWYRQSGYQRNQPIANYFCGYLAAQTFAALGMHGETPQAAEWFRLVRDELLGKLLLPQFLTKLDGGDWPEGWQYGELSAAEVAWVASAFKSAAGTDLKLPWLSQVIQHHLHALVPGTSAIYDNGDWSEHPTKPSALGLAAIALALESSDASGAAQARWMVRNQLPLDDHFWTMALIDGGDEKDPHLGAPLSTKLDGTGVSFMRSGWSKDAVWASFQSGPTIADHQHNDQGHFELFRGGDGLLVDGGAYNSAATLNHNSLLIFDHGRVLNYSPNQGTWGHGMKTTRFFDDGKAVVVAGDFTDAYFPNCIEERCSKRAATSVTRTMVYVRPSVLVLQDQVMLDKGADGLTWVAHVAAKPVTAQAVLSAKVGGSRVDVTTVEPGTKWTVRKEPSGGGDGPFRQNDTWGPMWRIEAESPKGQASRRMIHVAVAGAASDKTPTVSKIAGDGIVGVQGPAVVLFAESDKGGHIVVSGAEVGWLVGLKPHSGYTTKLSGDKTRCDVAVQPGGAVQANAGGALQLDLKSCGGTP